MAGYKRSVSRSRYESMLQTALMNLNQEAITYNETVKEWNARNPDKPKKNRKLFTYGEALGSRKKTVALIRFRIYRELHRSGYSYPSIGRIAGYDHTSILSGVRRIDDLEPIALSVQSDDTSTLELAA